MKIGQSLFGWSLTLVAFGPVATRAEPADDDFCVELRSMVAAAGEKPAFASLGPKPWDPRPALGFDNCSVIEMLEGHASFICVGEFPDSLAHWQRLNADLLRCLRGAARFTPRFDSRNKPSFNEAYFRAGRVTIHTAEQPINFDGRRGLSISIEQVAAD